MCYNVSMASTSEHISIRIPAQTMAALRREALELERSVSWVIVRKLSGRGVEGHAADGLEGVNPNTGRSREQVSSPAAPTKSRSCPECGALNGHQKWCNGGRS